MNSMNEYNFISLLFRAADIR